MHQYPYAIEQNIIANSNTLIFYWLIILTDNFEILNIPAGKCGWLEASESYYKVKQPKIQRQSPTTYKGNISLSCSSSFREVLGGKFKL